MEIFEYKIDYHIEDEDDIDYCESKTYKNEFEMQKCKRGSLC